MIERNGHSDVCSMTDQSASKWNHNSPHLQSSDNNPLVPQDRIVSYFVIVCIIVLPPALQAVYCLSTTERMNRIDQELLEAAKENNVPEVSRLLSVGADVNAKDRFGETPLHRASCGGHVQVVKKLLDHGADIERKDIYSSWTPLHCACLNDHVAVSNELLSRGANIEARGNRDRTPLHCASMYGNLPIVKALVSGGADILAANSKERLPFHLAVRAGKSEVAKYLLQQLYATIRRLPLHELLKDLTRIGDPNSMIHHFVKQLTIMCWYG
jgi:ankyrin repeat protein